MARPLGPPQLDQRSRSRAEAAGRRISPGRLLTAGRCCGGVKRRSIPEQPTERGRFWLGCCSLGCVVRRWSSAFCPKFLLLRLLRLLVPESRASSHLPVLSTTAPAAAPSRRLPCKSPGSSVKKKRKKEEGQNREKSSFGVEKNKIINNNTTSGQRGASNPRRRCSKTLQCLSRCLSCCQQLNDGRRKAIFQNKVRSGRCFHACWMNKNAFSTSRFTSRR